MRAPFILILLAATATPAAAQDDAIHRAVAVAARRADQDRERIQRDAERERERVQREAERARERTERERERARDSQRQGGIQETERTTRTLRIGPKGELHLANISGDIVISRGGGSEAVVEIVKTARGRTTEDAKEALALVAVDVNERGNRADVRVRYPRGDEMRRANRRNLPVDVGLNVTVPEATRVEAHSISGTVSARGIKGDVVLHSVSGTVRVANGGGITEAESVSGNVEVVDTQLNGGLAASSASGAIILKQVKARQLRLHSVSGDVVMDTVDCPRVEARSVSGQVKFGGALPKNSRFEFGSHSGDVLVAIAGGGFELEATSFSGAVRSEFPFASGDQEPGRGRHGHSLRGVHGDGSSVLELSTFSGNIVLTKR